MYEKPQGLFAEQCISIRTVDGEFEARNIEIMRATNTMFADDYGVRYAKDTFVETGVRGDEAWKLHHRKSEYALGVLEQVSLKNKK